MDLSLQALYSKARPYILPLALAAGGYAAGRFAAPTKVVTTEHETIRTVLQEDTAAREQVQKLVAQLEVLKKDTRRVETTKTLPDGTKTTRVETDTHLDRAKDARTDTIVDLATRTTQQTETMRETTNTKTIEHAAHRWFVGAVVLVDPKAVSGIRAGPVVGGQLLGPLSWSVMVAVPTTQPLNMPTLGASITLGF